MQTKNLLIGFGVLAVVGFLVWGFMDYTGPIGIPNAVITAPSPAALSTNSDIDSSLKDILTSQGLASLDARDCSKISGEQFIKLGDAIMAPITGDETHHSMMEGMMGGEESTTTKAMHAGMGRTYLDCSAASATVTPPKNADVMNIITIKWSGSLGDYLVDARGMTLYTYANDTADVSNCNDSCATAWPPYTSAQKPADLAMLYKDLGMISRKDGSFQFTWKGLPLYFFTKDTKVGDTNGEGSKGVWQVIRF